MHAAVGADEQRELDRRFAIDVNLGEGDVLRARRRARRDALLLLRLRLGGLRLLLLFRRRGLRTRARFCRITGASMHESHPHDIHITKEAPNYSVEFAGEKQ